MRLIPIVALVPEDDLAELRQRIAQSEPPPPAFAAVMERNGWTEEAIHAGRAIRAALEVSR